MLGFLGGIWLVLAPSALGYQLTGTGWINATRNDHWFGLGLAILSAAGFVLYVLSLLRETREGGIIPDGEDVHEQHPERRVSPRPSPVALQKDNSLDPLAKPPPSKSKIMKDTRRRQPFVQPETLVPQQTISPGAARAAGGLAPILRRALNSSLASYDTSFRFGHLSRLYIRYGVFNSQMPRFKNVANVTHAR